MHVCSVFCLSVPRSVLFSSGLNDFVIEINIYLNRDGERWPRGTKSDNGSQLHNAGLIPVMVLLRLQS
jgi:hypothetical protein